MNRSTPQQLKPWYRHAGPWMLISGPAAVVIAGIVTAWISVKYQDPVVDDDYYKHGKAINIDLKRSDEAARQGISATLLLGDDGRTIRATLRSTSNSQLPAALSLKLLHPTRNGMDQIVTLRLSGSMYQAQLPAALTGRWYISLEDLAHHWRLSGTWVSEKNRSIELKASSTQEAQSQF